MNLSISEELAYSTVRVSTDTGTGTGFFYQFSERENNFHVPAIVTNKHVISGTSKGNFLLTVADDNGEPHPSSMAREAVIKFAKELGIEPPWDDIYVDAERIRGK